MVGFTGRKFKRGNGLPTHCGCYAETNHEFPRIRDIREIRGFRAWQFLRAGVKNSHFFGVSEAHRDKPGGSLVTLAGDALICCHVRREPKCRPKLPRGWEKRKLLGLEKRGNP